MCHLGKDSLLNKCHVRQMRKEEREREREREREVESTMFVDAN